MALVFLSLIQDSKEKGVFSFPSSFWQFFPVVLIMSLSRILDFCYSFSLGTYYGQKLSQSWNTYCTLTALGVSHSQNLRQCFISFPSQHWPQPFHALTILQNLFLTARNHSRWEWESLKSRGFLEAKSLRREKWSQGRLGNCSRLWEEKKENRSAGTGHPSFLQLYKVFRLHTVRFYFYNIFERIVFRNEGQMQGCRFVGSAGRRWLWL